MHQMHLQRLRQITKEEGLKTVATKLGISPQALIRFLRAGYLPPRVAKRAEELYSIPAVEIIAPRYKKFLFIMGITIPQEEENVSK